MKTERGTLALILLSALAAWGLAGFLVSRYLPHPAALSELFTVPESWVFGLLALRICLLLAPRPARRAGAAPCRECVWDGTRQVCAC
jgi:hypothetical protein